MPNDPHATRARFTATVAGPTCSWATRWSSRPCSGSRIGTTSDTDLWGHVRFGQDLLRDTGAAAGRYRRMPSTSDRPWINHEWLAELAMGAAFDAAGVAGLLLLKAALLLGSLIVVAWAVDRAAGGRAAGIAIFSLASLMGVLPLFATLRPQGSPFCCLPSKPRYSLPRLPGFWPWRRYSRCGA